jgi:cell division protease FtsH
MGFDTGRQVSPETAQAIDQEVTKIIELARSRAAQILAEHQEQLKTLAHRLLEKEVVEGEELREMLKESGSPG